MKRRTRRFLAVSGVGSVAIALWIYAGPVPGSVVRPRIAAGTTIVTDRNGVALDIVSARLLAARDLNAASGAEKNKAVPSLAKRAHRLAAATIAAEDQRFRSHPGIDAMAIGRAVLHDVRARAAVEGGSTLTQQLVKLRLGRSGRQGGWRSKVTEAIGAVRLDRVWSKDRVLSTFLAEAPYGGRVIGAEDAARAYFDVPVSQLSWGQAAYLAALPQRPTRFNPRRDAAAANDRKRWILRRMRADHVITEVELATALHEKLDVSTGVGAPVAPHFVAMVREGAAPGQTKTPTGATVFRSTIDASLQRSVAGIAARQRALLRKHGAANVAVVVLDNATGAVRAWEGSGDSTDVENGGAINGPLRKRQTGSTIKAFIYALAFDAGHGPGDLVDDSPFERPGLTTGFRPKNYDHRFRGPVTMREALGSSINVPAVKLLAEVGPQALVDELSKVDIAVPGGVARHGLALALGVAEIDLLDLTRAYGAIARGGRVLKAVAMEPAAKQRGGRRVMSSAAAFLVTDVLADNEARAPAFGRNSLLSFPFPVAAKTGTSQNFHDNWVVGFTPQFTVGVWVGNFDRRPLKGATGITGAGPLFHDVMLAAHQRLTPRWGVDRATAMSNDVPAELASVSICVDAGCTNRRNEYRWIGRALTAPAPVASAPTRLTLIEPRSGGLYVRDSSVPTASQRLPLKASGGVSPYAFTVDGTSATTSWPLATGAHEACVVDARLKRSCAKFVVR
jgi:penicillin-binding protein 1C